MNKQIIALILLSVLIVFSGCLEMDPSPESLVLTTHIQRGGHGTIRVDWQNITSSKEGVEGKNSITAFMKAFKEADRTELGESFQGCTNIVHGIGYDSHNKLNGYVQGRFPDIFVLFRSFDSSWPYRLRKDTTFSFNWDGEVLSVKQGWNIPQITAESEAQSKNIASSIKIVITTEGEFTSNSCGQISDNRKKLVIKDVDNRGWGFSIKGLSENE